MTVRKLLLAGGGHADVPLIQAAQRLGFHVITSGNRATDLGHPYADETELADFSSPQAMLALAQKHSVSAVLACCNDFSALSCAWVAEQLGLPGHDRYETACLLHEKDRYREFALANGIASPRAIGFDSLEDAMAGAGSLRLPLIIKPVDLTGGKGISTVTMPDELAPALAKAFTATRAGRVVVEEFLEGTRHGFTSLLRSGKVVFHFQDNEHYYLNRFMVSAASTPARVPAGTAEKLVATTERIASLLALVDGIVHIQYILHAGEPVIIEICRRAPGDLYIKLVEHATGVDYPAQIVRAASGLGLAEVQQAGVRGFYTRHCVMGNRTGRIKDLVIDPLVAGKIIDSMLWWRPGDEISDILTHKLGILFFRFDNEAEMLDLTERMQDLVKVVTEP